MSNNTTNRYPKALSESEWQEIAAVPQVEEAWGLAEQNGDSLGQLLASMAFGRRLAVAFTTFGAEERS